MQAFSVSQLTSMLTSPSISLQWKRSGPKLIQMPLGLSVVQMVFTQSKMLLAVSRKKQLATPQKCYGRFEQTKVNSPPVMLNSVSPVISSEGARSGIVTLLQASSSLQQQALELTKGKRVNCCLRSVQLMMKLDPNSMKYVSSFPSAPNPARTSSNTNLPSPHPGTSTRSPSLRYYLHFSAIRTQSSFSTDYPHHSRKNCFRVVLILERLLREVSWLGTQAGSSSSTVLMKAMIQSRKAWLCLRALSSIRAFLCWFWRQNSLLVTLLKRQAFSSRTSRLQFEKADFTSSRWMLSNQSRSSIINKTTIITPPAAVDLSWEGTTATLPSHNIQMSRQLRPSTGKTRPLKRHATPSSAHQQGIENHPRDSSKFKERFEAIRSARDRKPLPETPALAPDTKEQLQGSKSKFLQRFDNIRCLRDSLQESREPEEEIRRQVEFESNRKRIFLEDKLSTLSSGDSLPVSQALPPEKTALRRQPRTHHQHPLSRPTSAGIEFVTLTKTQREELILRVQGKADEGGQMTAYWKRENRFVSLIPLERNEKVSFDHPNILSIYAEATIDDKRFVLSDEYKNCSLRNLLQQFGPFGQGLARRYLRQVAVGLQHMHYHRRAHNRLGLTAILYNQNGELFINAVRATSFVPSREELATGRQLHFFAPEFLLSKGFSKSLKNDVWALGCLAILMLTTTGLSHSPLHPYNAEQFRSEEAGQMVDNLKQLHPAYFAEVVPEERSYKNPQAKAGKLSEAANNFIASCLEPLADDRPSIESLLEHQFFEGFEN